MRCTSIIIKALPYRMNMIQWTNLTFHKGFLQRCRWSADFADATYIKMLIEAQCICLIFQCLHSKCYSCISYCTWRHESWNIIRQCIWVHLLKRNCFIQKTKWYISRNINYFCKILHLHTPVYYPFGLKKRGATRDQNTFYDTFTPI